MKTPRRRPPRKASTWRTSTAWRAIGSAAIRSYNAKRHTLPRCGAKRKRDGEPCRQPAMENGRCPSHGGLTPKGDQWHQTQWPNRDAPNAEKKLQRKLRDQQRAAKKRAARLAAMTPEQRARHEAWHRARAPGSAAERERRRQDRKQAADIRARLNGPERPQNDEAARLRDKIEALEAERDQLAALLQDETGLGVFG